MKNDRWVFHSSAAAQPAGEGVTRRVLAYCQDLMCVENTFEKGACGALHHHPHTQITYVVSGRFEFEIDGEKRVVTAGDTMLKMNGVTHGCVCLEAGVLLDIFTPMKINFPRRARKRIYAAYQKRADKFPRAFFRPKLLTRFFARL